SASRYRTGNLATRLLATRLPRIRQGRGLGTPEERPPILNQKLPPVPRPSSTEIRLAAARPVLDRLWSLALDLGRLPEPEEISNLLEVEGSTGSLAKAKRLIQLNYDLTILEAAAKSRANDIRLFMATQHFAKRPA